MYIDRKNKTIRDFIKLTASKIGFTIDFRGKGKDEVGYVSKITAEESNVKEGQEIIMIDPAYFRPLEVNTLLGDSKKAREKLNWSPKINLDEMRGNGNGRYENSTYIIEG